MDELKQCPFCGGEAHLDREEIFCDCGAKISLPLYEYGIGADGGFPTFKEAKAQMIETWNNRAENAAVRGRWIAAGKDHCCCSECKHIRNIRSQIGWKFCPNCGARMDGDSQ